MFLVVTVRAVKANPVYPGELSMSDEHLVIEISKVGGQMWAGVNGTYGFSVIWPTNSSAVMYFPVAPEAQAISAKIDYLDVNLTLHENQLDWTYSGTSYSTLVGDFPFINWSIEQVPNAFLIIAHYEHPLSIIPGGNYAFLYAWGTAQYTSKAGCWAYFTAYVSKDIAPTMDYIGVYLATKDRVTGPANYSITSLDGMWEVDYAAEAGYEDFLLTVRPRLLGDVNLDGIVDMKDLSIAAKAFGARPGDPRWNPEADVNGYGTVDMRDIGLIAKNIGKQYSTQEQVRDAVMGYIEANHPETAQYMKGLIWTGGNTTPQGIVGAETYSYTSDGWNVTMQYPVVPNAIYSITANYTSAQTIVSSQGTIVSAQTIVSWQGTWQNGTITETSYNFTP
jgi:hypothetical protein